MTDAEQRQIIWRYVDREITAEEAADDIGPGTAVVDVSSRPSSASADCRISATSSPRASTVAP